LFAELSEVAPNSGRRLWRGLEQPLYQRKGQVRYLCSLPTPPFEPEEWPQVVINAFQTLSDNNWVPCATLIIGLPDEQEEDIQLTIDLVKKLHSYKSLIVPLFMVSEGGLIDKTKSFQIDAINRKESELFLTCWQHNLDWAKIFLNEYFVTKAGFGKGYGIKLVFSYALKQAQILLETCKEKYDYNIPAMIKDAREGKYPVALPMRLISKVIMGKTSATAHKQNNGNQE
ncbi:MAG: hypothetical protein M1167_00955, partial [Chloroflexi bacterium]|nr:hypothetical protein [Chloroflexota bacterium]